MFSHTPAMEANPDSTARPLAGIRVIDFTRALAGPYATFLLAGLGAEVIKVEDPVNGDLARDNSPYIGRDGVVQRKRHDDDVSVSHLSRGRGKHGISLNLKAPEAASVFRDLVAISDVVVENFASGTADRLGIGYAVAKAVNPRIVSTRASFTARSVASAPRCPKAARPWISSSRH
jgi:CoA:oxalate CoA-transferase